MGYNKLLVKWREFSTDIAATWGPWDPPQIQKTPMFPTVINSFFLLDAFFIRNLTSLPSFSLGFFQDTFTVKLSSHLNDRSVGGGYPSVGQETAKVELIEAKRTTIGYQ